MLEAALRMSSSTTGAKTSPAPSRAREMRLSRSDENARGQSPARLFLTQSRRGAEDAEVRLKKRTGTVPVKSSSGVSSFEVSSCQNSVEDGWNMRSIAQPDPLSFVFCPMSSKPQNQKPETRNPETSKLINSETAQSPRFLSTYESSEIFFDFPLARRAGI